MLTDIDPDPNQPRRSFHAAKQNAFEQSVSQHGVIQPILVQRDGNRYRIIAGERRYRAASNAGHDDIPAVIRDDLPSDIALEYQLLENLMRQDLNPVDRADGMLRLMVSRNQTDLETVQKDIATRYRDTSIPSAVSVVVDEVLTAFEISLSTFHRFHVKLLKLPDDLLEAVRTGRLEHGHTLLLERIADPKERRVWMARIDDQPLSREALQKALNQKKLKKPATMYARDIARQFKSISSSLVSLDEAQTRWVLAEMQRIQETIQTDLSSEKKAARTKNKKES